MKHLDDTLCIFVGHVEGDPSYEYRIILNNDSELTIRELPFVGYGGYKLEIEAGNFFSLKRSNELLNGEKTLTLIRNLSMPTGKRDRWGDMDYSDTPTKITFKRITLDVEIAYFDNKVKGFAKD